MFVGTKKPLARLSDPDNLSVNEACLVRQQRECQAKHGAGTVTRNQHDVAAVQTGDSP